jgi:hypothetical protein
MIIPGGKHAGQWQRSISHRVAGWSVILAHATLVFAQGALGTLNGRVVDPGDGVFRE